MFKGIFMHVQTEHPDSGMDWEHSPSLIHSYKHWVSAFISLYLPPLDL